MLIRRKILPKTAGDTLSFIFILIIVPVIYWFELWVVLPFAFDSKEYVHIFHFCVGNFVMANIIGNFIYIILCDTSIRQMSAPTRKAKVKEGWRFCAICEAVTPPRSWHCIVCKTCILKRDHHCVFTGCCIGHKNQRYFLMFIFYLFVATSYSFMFNNYFMWKMIPFEFPSTVIKLIFPLAMFVFGLDNSAKQLYLLLYTVTTIGMLFSGVLLFYHLQSIFLGCTSNEKNKKIYTYNLGWKQNFIQVFGRRWYLTWILPYIESELPQNGIDWHKISMSDVNNLKDR